MRRIINYHLNQWRERRDRRPLLLRGARQVGKTHTVRSFGKKFKHYIEINFEEMASAKVIFEGDLSIKKLLRDLSLFAETPIIPGETLIFLDEIQEMPRAIVALRYFYEGAPDIHVIGAGSLLDFAIEEIGVPVGRVEFLYLHPMSFIEFLIAGKHHLLVNEIANHAITEPVNPRIHEKFLQHVYEYLAIGGMPEAVQCWVDTTDLVQCGRVQQRLVNAYQQDIPKYSKKLQVKYVELLFNTAPLLLAKRFKYSQIHGEYRKRELAPALELLVKAGLVHKIYHSDGQGIPLGAQVDNEKFKLGFLDIALAQLLMGANPRDWLLKGLETLVNRGEIVESMVGQELLAYAEPDSRANLYYWQRENAKSQAEVDYLLQKDTQIIPIEVKSQHGSTLKSMQLFLQSHPKSEYGIRFSSHNYSIYDGIHSYPLYAIAVVILANQELWKYILSED